MSENNPLEGGPPEPVAPKMGTFARLIGVFFEPTKTFTAIAANPGWDWLVPLAILLALGIGAARMIGPKVDVDEAVNNQIRVTEKLSGREVTSEVRTKIEEGVHKQVDGFGKPLQAGIQIVVTVAVIFLIGGIRHGAAAMFGAKKSYMGVVAGYAWVQVIMILPTILTIFVIFSSDSLSLNDVQFQRVLKSNLGAFLDFQTTHKAVLAIASSIDIFDFWFYFVNSIALWKTTRFTKKQAFGVAGALWGLYIVFKILLGFVGQALLP